MTGLALLAAVAAMLANSFASLLQARGSRQAERPGSLWRQPSYVVGLAVDGLGWLLSAAALRVLPVFAVQSVLAGSVAVTSLARRGGPSGRSRRDLAAIASVVVGLALASACAVPGRAVRLPDAAAPVLLGAAAVLIAAVVPAVRRLGPLPSAFLAGLAYSGVPLSVRAVHVASSLWTSVNDLIREPLAYAVVVFTAVGVRLLASALRRGDVGAVTAVLSLTTVLVPGLSGLLLLGDEVRPGWMPVLVVALLVTVAGVVALASRAPAVATTEPLTAADQRHG